MKKFLMVGLLVLLAACSPPTTVQTYVDPSLTKAMVDAGGVTILPIGLGSRVRDANLPELRRQLSQRVSQSVGKLFPAARTVGIEQTLEVLEKGNLLDGFSSASQAFDQTGLLRSQTLDQITSATSTRYALFPYLQSASSQTNPGGLFTTVESRASFTVVLWDKALQKSVFEGTASGSATFGLFGGGLIIDAIYAATDNAIAKLRDALK